jgi:trimeric autotransporter adhesin
MKKTAVFILLIFASSSFLFAQIGVTNYGSGTVTKGVDNSFFGVDAGKSMTYYGNNNVFVGKSSGENTIAGALNTFIGSNSGSKNTYGSYNTFLGHKSGYENTNGEFNTYLGSSAGYSNKGGFNTYVGGGAGALSTQSIHNTFLGYNSGTYNNGNFNTYLGTSAGYANYLGNDNTYIGYQAGYYSKGSGNVFLGNKAGVFETGDNKLYIENSDAKTPLIFGDFQTNRVGINTKKTSDNGVNYTLSVNGKMRATEVQVYTGWADYVFEPDYKLRPLNEVANFIAQNKHLPDVPSAIEVEKNGIWVGEMSKIQMQKIEELTLYVLELHQANLAKDQALQDLQKQIKELKNSLQSVQNQVNQLNAQK